MTNKIKMIIKKRKDDIMREPEKVYSELLKLVKQALHVRIVADKMWRYRRKWVFANFSHIALENYTVLQLWKLFDKKNSVFHIWDVVEYLKIPKLTEWLENKIAEKQMQEDIRLISEWRGDAVGHRGEAGYYAPDIREIKFTTARVSEKRLHDFLLKFLCQIKFETQQIPVEHTMEELKLGLMGFEAHIKKEMAKIFKEYDDKKSN